MKLLEDFKLLLYFYLFSIQMVNDLNYNYIKKVKSLERTVGIINENNKSQYADVSSYNNVLIGKLENLKRIQTYHKYYSKVSSLSSYTSFEFSDLVDLDEFATRFKSIVCNNDLIGNFVYSDQDKFINNEACLITLVPCGDLNDWHLIEIEQKRPYVLKSHLNDSMLDMTFQGHWERLSNTNEIIEKLNTLKKRLSQTDLINLLQEKKLGNFGFYTNFKRDQLFERTNFDIRNLQNSVELKTCDYLEVTLYDSSKNQLMRKQINRDLFEEIKRNYTKYFNFEEDTFIDRQQALEIAHRRLRDLQIEVRRVFYFKFSY